MEIPKVPLRLIKEPPGAVAFGGQQAAPVLEAPGGAAGDGAEDVEVREQGLRRRCLGAHRRRWGVVGEAQHEQRVGQDELACGLRPPDVVLIQTANLARREAMRRNRIGEAHAGLALGARQRHEVLHRSVRDDAAVLDVLLDGVGERAHQTEAPRHPAHGPIEPTRQAVERQSVIFVQRTQQPGLLERALGGVRLQEMAKDQGVPRRHVPEHRGDRVAVQPAQAADAFVAVHYHVHRVAGHDDDRHLLAGVGERGQQSPLPGRLSDAESLVAEIQLMKFKVHVMSRGAGRPHGQPADVSRAPDVPDRPRPPAQLRTRPPTDDAALLSDMPAHDRRHTCESAESSRVGGTLIHHATTGAIGPLVVAMIQPSFRTLLVASARLSHVGAPGLAPTRRRTVDVSTIAGGTNAKGPRTRSARAHPKDRFHEAAAPSARPRRSTATSGRMNSD